MSFRLIAALLFVSAICENKAQLLVPLHGACSSSVQCIGVAICVQSVCQCPPVYAAIGITCIYSGTEIPLEPPGFPVPVPAPIPASAVIPGPPGLLPALPPAPIVPGAVPMPGPATFAYPGGSCGQAKTCVGGSFCYQGSCGCPSGYIVSGYSCVQNNIVDAAPLPVPARPMPFAAPGPFAGPAPPFAHGHAPIAVPAPPVAHGPEPYLHPAPLPMNNNPVFFGQISEQFIPNGPPNLAPEFPQLVPGYPDGPHPGHFGHPAPLPCPSHQVLVGSACLPKTVVAKFPAGVLCVNGGGCTGGSVCVNSVCTCPPSYVWAKTGCVMASKVHVDHMAPMPGPGPMPFAAHPAPIAQPAFPHLQHMPLPDAPPVAGLVALGSSCVTHNQCVAGAACQLGVCTCRPSYVPYGSVCILRRHKAKEREPEERQKKH